MPDTPAPLTPPECDLRGLEWMPVYGARLTSSEAWLSASPEGRVAMITLQWAAWQQTPAASLPDDDRVLAQLAGFGPAVGPWRRKRAEALRGWIKCSDGRLYHPFLAELAVDAFDRRCRDNEKRAVDRDRLARWRERRRQQRERYEDETQPDGNGRNEDETRFETRCETSGETTDETRRKGNNKKEDPPSTNVDVPPAAPSACEPSQPKARSKRREQVPEDWQPSDSDLNFAACHMRPEEVAAEVAQFRDHHRSRGNAFRDVSAAWRQWCRNCSRWKARPGRPQPPSRSKLDWMFDEQDEKRWTGQTISQDGSPA